MIEDKNKKNCKTTEISDKSELYFRNNLQICAYKLVEIFWLDSAKQSALVIE